MKKLLIPLLMAFLPLQAQKFAEVNAKLKELEKRSIPSENPENLILENIKFTFRQSNEKNILRSMLDFRNKEVTLIEITEDEQGNRLSYTAYKGDFIKNNYQLSLRFTHKDGNILDIPTAKNFIINDFQDNWYLIDINTKNRWKNFK